MSKKKGLSIRFKMFFEISAILLAAVTLILFINTRYLNDIYLFNKKKDMMSSAEYINTLDIKSGIYFGSVTSLETEKNISVDIYDRDGTPLYLSTKSISANGGSARIVDNEVQKDGSVIEIHEIDEKQYILLKKNLSFGGELEIYANKSDIDTNADLALTFTWGSVILIFLASLIFIFFYTRRFTKPLIKMSEITEKMSNMDFSEKCEVKSRDEIGRLSDSINNLSVSLDTTLNDLNEKNKQLSDDIEKKQTLEQLRKEFISSISHELKTPIAIIKGYAEGAQMMLDGDDSEGAAEYCEIITKESDKMNALVYELLELSRYELGDSRLEIEKFELKPFIEDYTDAEKIVFDEKGIRFSAEIPENAWCEGDTVKLSMVLNNFVSNAVAHASGEKVIKITCRDMADKYRITVFNSGEHIKDEDIEKIWKSFYRADKSHSRKEGRFGLGLSIVSAIQNLHGMEYGVKNAENGVEFWFDIKKVQ
ncbi:MAG: ATP-binding protein [Candidatus Fimenecus sp.]